MEINNERELRQVMANMLKQERISQEEYDAVTDYVCGIWDALSCMDIDEEDFM